MAQHILSQRLDPVATFFGSKMKCGGGGGGLKEEMVDECYNMVEARGLECDL